MTTATGSRPGATPPEPTGAARPRWNPVAALNERVRTGELGPWPVIIGLIIIWVVFQTLNSNFLSEPLSFVLVLLIGLAIGALQGFFFAFVGVPAFVVTLAGNLGWLGFQLWLLFPRGTINFSYGGFVGNLTLKKLPDIGGWIVGAVVVGLYAIAALTDHWRRTA